MKVRFWPSSGGAIAPRGPIYHAPTDQVTGSSMSFAHITMGESRWNGAGMLIYYQDKLYGEEH